MWERENMPDFASQPGAQVFGAFGSQRRAKCWTSFANRNGLFTSCPRYGSVVRRVTILIVLLLAVSPSGDDKLISADRTEKGALSSVRLTNGTRVTGRIEHRDKHRLRVRMRDDFAVTVPIEHLPTLSHADGSHQRELRPLLAEGKRRSYKTIALSTEHKLTIRNNPTTQVHMRVVEWPGQTFLLWFPEMIENVWAQWDAEVAKQDFRVSEEGALVWSRQFQSKASVVATMTPRIDAILLEIRVKAGPNHEIKVASPANCLHVSAAPDFACNDYSRIFVRVKKKWRSFLDLRTAPGAPKLQSP